MDLQYDFCVVGGGVAGVCCAISAARNGLRTVLFQNRPVLGGNSSGEVGVRPVGSQTYNAFAAETGIVAEILLRDRSVNHAALADTGRTNSIYELTLYQMCRETPLLDVYLNTQVTGVEVENSRISAVLAEQLGSERKFRVTAKQFADCTGDAYLGEKSGADAVYGREGRNVYHENLAPENEDAAVMGSSMILMAKRMERACPFVPPADAVYYPDEQSIGMMRSIPLPQGEEYSGFWWMEMSFPYHSIEDNAQIYDQLLLHIWGVWDYLKNRSPHRDQFACYALDWISPVVGKRESRRLLGDYIMTEQDCLRDGQFYDSVCYGGWYLDEHVKGGILSPTMPPVFDALDETYLNYSLAAPYSIPLRALYSRNIQNLWMAGRNISVSHIALCSVRVQCTLGNIGQAVGTAAAAAISGHMSPRELANSPQIQDLHQKLLGQDVRILGFANKDKDDKARKAAVCASAAPALESIAPSARFISLSTPCAQIFPASENLTSFSPYLKNESLEEGIVYYHLESVQNLWQKGEGKIICRGQIPIPNIFEGFLEIPVCAIEDRGLYRMVLHSNAPVQWAVGIYQPHGTNSQYFYNSNGKAKLPGKFDSFDLSQVHYDIPAFSCYNQYRRDHFSYSFLLTPAQKPYEAENMLDGHAWPYDGPHVWLTEEENAFVELSFSVSQRISEIRLFFDTDLNCSYSAKEGFWTPPSCPSNFTIFTFHGNVKTRVGMVTQNCQRYRCVKFDPIEADKIRIELMNPHRNRIGVYEIRVY